MFATLKTAALSAMIGLGAITAMPAGAQADSIRLGIGDRHDDFRFSVQIGDRDHRRDRHWDNRRGCNASRALNKAERLGLRRARVVDVDRRTIDVVGRRHGDRVRVTFARAPGCPVVRW